MIGGKGWAIADSLGSKHETMFSQASGDVQMSLTDKYTMWSSLSTMIPGPGENPKYNLVRRLQIHCFSGQPLSGDCDAGGALAASAPAAYSQPNPNYYPAAAPMSANTPMALQALRMREQQSLQQATENAMTQQAIQTATFAASMEEQKQTKLRRQVLMRNCLQRYETSPMLLQTCLAQVKNCLQIK